MSKQQMDLVQEAECARCHKHFKGGVQVFQQLGYRVQDNKLTLQSHCKSCRKIKVTPEIKKKVDEFAKKAKVDYTKQIEELKKIAKDQRKNALSSYRARVADFRNKLIEGEKS